MQTRYQLAAATGPVFRPTPEALYEKLFNVILPGMLCLFIGIGMHLNGIKPVAKTITRTITQVKANFHIQEPVHKKKPSPVVKKPVAVKKKSEPVDLSKAPQLAAKTDDVQKSSAASKKVRRVYGLRKVYSTGLGAGGSMSDAVIGKLGNTINKEVDDVKATVKDLKGEVVSVTTITSAPRFKKKAKPAYTEDMIANRTEGVVKVKVLVDVDGKIKKARALNDLGNGAADQALQACRAMEFEPAMRGDEAVAVWIVIPIRFVLLS